MAGVLPKVDEEEYNSEEEDDEDDGYKGKQRGLRDQDVEDGDDEEGQG